jgi:hypothetical protein
VHPEIQSAAGLLAIAASIFLFDAGALFPGWWAILPTLGTALLIAVGEKSWINRYLLSFGPLVFVGLISYPIYLWHWPLLSFAHIVEGGTPQIATRLTAVALSFVLAWLTYAAIEKRIRLKPNAWAVACVCGLIVSAVLGMTAFSGAVHARSERFGVGRIVRQNLGDWGFPGSHLKPVKTSLGYHFVRGETSSKVLFIGDSHMEQYYPRVDRLLTENPLGTKSVVFVTQRACPPLSYIPGLSPEKCAGLLQNSMAQAQDPAVDTIVIGAAWSHYRLFTSEMDARAFEDVAATITTYRQMGKKVYVILPIPRGSAFAPDRIVKRRIGALGFEIVRSIPRAQIVASLQSVSDRLDAAAGSAAQRF